MIAKSKNYQSFEILAESENIFLLLLIEDFFSIYKKIKTNIKLITQFIFISNKININYLFTFFDLANLSKTVPLYK